MDRQVTIDMIAAKVQLNNSSYLIELGKKKLKS